MNDEERAELINIVLCLAYTSKNMRDKFDRLRDMVGDNIPIHQENAVRLLKHHEGFRAKPYKCSAGKLTVGYGWNLEDMGITKGMAEIVLRSMVADIDKWLDTHFNFYQGLNDVRKSVIVDMVYNLGKNGFLGFVNTIEALEDGDYDKASREILDSDAGRELKTRYKKLAEMMRKGQ